ncbi:MAG: sigma-70 family RNA polymerase sigma factor [Acidobacteria bacterium]|nr:sigma-70 family RNA polymerase sigma factor [Acidobacteriota bacterium]
MAAPPAPDVTQLLLAWRDGDEGALDRLLPVVYTELHNLAHGRMRAEMPGLATLQTTALIHEAYVRLVDGARVPWQNHSHFYAVCARLMRRILVDRARARRADKRGGDRPIALGDWQGAVPAQDEAVMAVHEALERLAQADRRKADVVELRYFGGLTVEETADALGVSPETVLRDWKVARLWLQHELKGQEAAADEPRG